MMSLRARNVCLSTLIVFCLAIGSANASAAKLIFDFFSQVDLPVVSKRLEGRHTPKLPFPPKSAEEAQMVVELLPGVELIAQSSLARDISLTPDDWNNIINRYIRLMHRHRPESLALVARAAVGEPTIEKEWQRTIEFSININDIIVDAALGDIFHSIGSVDTHFARQLNARQSVISQFRICSRFLGKIYETKSGFREQALKSLAECAERHPLDQTILSVSFDPGCGCLIFRLGIGAPDDRVVRVEIKIAKYIDNLEKIIFDNDGDVRSGDGIVISERVRRKSKELKDACNKQNIGIRGCPFTISEEGRMRMKDCIWANYIYDHRSMIRDDVYRPQIDCIVD